MLHARQRRSRGALERRVDRRDGFDDDWICASIACAAFVERRVDRWRDLRFEQLVERRLVLGLQRFERQSVFGEKADGGGIEQRGEARGYISGIGMPNCS